MSRSTVALWIAICSSVTAPAVAHAPPQANGIQWIPGKSGERAVVRTNRGLIVQEPASNRFRIVCNDAFQVSLSEVPPLTVGLDGRLLLGTYAAGLVLSSPDLCGYEPVAGAFDGFYPLAVHADARGLLYAAALPYDGSSAALLRSSDQGRTGMTLSELPGAPSALQVASSDSSRLYVSVTTAEGNLSFGSILTSADAGVTFEEHSIELDASELRVFLLAVDPKDPQLLFARTQSRDGITPERLLRSEDGGATFERVLSAPGPIVAVVAADGVVWAGGASGLYHSDDRGRSFAAVGGTALTRVGCLASHGGAIYACGYSAGEFGVKVSWDGAGAFDWFLRFHQVTGRLDCPADSDEGKLCGPAFADWAMEQGIPAGEVGGTHDTDSPPPEHSHALQHDDGASCQFQPVASSLRSSAWLGAAVAFALRCRYRSQRRREPIGDKR